MRIAVGVMEDPICRMCCGVNEVKLPLDTVPKTQKGEKVLHQQSVEIYRSLKVDAVI